MQVHPSAMTFKYVMSQGLTHNPTIDTVSAKQGGTWSHFFLILVGMTGQGIEAQPASLRTDSMDILTTRPQSRYILYSVIQYFSLFLSVCHQFPLIGVKKIASRSVQ